MEKFLETNYDDVLNRIFIRIKIKEKWDNASLAEAVKKHQSQLKEWLKEYITRRLANINDEDLTKEELIDIVKWLDNIGIPPVRLKSESPTLLKNLEIIDVNGIHLRDVYVDGGRRICGSLTLNWEKTLKNKFYFSCIVCKKKVIIDKRTFSEREWRDFVKGIVNSDKMIKLNNL